MTDFFKLKSKHVASNKTDKFSCDWDRLDGPGIESRWRWNFPHKYISALSPTLSPIQWLPGFSPA